jgi:hypothetical protein
MKASRFLRSLINQRRPQFDRSELLRLESACMDQLKIQKRQGRQFALENLYRKIALWRVSERIAYSCC